jgi:hypothetical protein
MTRVINMVLEKAGPPPCLPRKAENNLTVKKATGLFLWKAFEIK